MSSKKNKTKPIEETRESNLLERSLLLLKEAQSGFLSTIGGHGPYEDKVNGVFFTRIEGKESQVFLFSQWSELSTNLIKELEDVTGRS